MQMLIFSALVFFFFRLKCDKSLVVIIAPTTCHFPPFFLRVGWAVEFSLAQYQLDAFGNHGGLRELCLLLRQMAKLLRSFIKVAD
jgi:hypothetical protein